MPSFPEDLWKSYTDAELYPRNLITPEQFEFKLRSFSNQLDERADVLFCGPSQASLHILQKSRVDQDYKSCDVHDFESLHKALIPNGKGRAECAPLERIFFIHAPHSRASLRISRVMFVRLLSFYQVTPVFLDFVVTFGQEITPRDAHFSGFRSEIKLDSQYSNEALKAIGRSGRGFHHCYNLKSVEPSPGYANHPYSIRQVAMFHTLDVVTGSSTFFAVKGGQLMKQRISAVLQRGGQIPKEPVAGSFSSSLTVQLIVAEWSDEHWRSYINFLNEKFQQISGRVLTASADSSLREDDEIKHLSKYHRAATMLSAKSTTRNTGFQLFRWMMALFERHNASRDDDCELGNAGTQQQPSTAATEQPFDFSEIQRMADTEEKVAAAKRVLKCNLDTLQGLSSHYADIWDHGQFPMHVRCHCKAQYESFQHRLRSIMSSMNRQQFNVENLLATIEVRKNVLNNMFTYKSIVESKRQAAKSQRSAQNMEDMTDVMYEIARKTERETVAMKVIALVTLFFLPGTFICTFMSAGIVQYAANGSSAAGQQKVFSPAALRFFFALCIPIMAMTILTWWLCHQYVKARTEDRYQKIARQLLNKPKPHFEHGGPVGGPMGGPVASQLAVSQ